jgi:hypothetical protein
MSLLSETVATVVQSNSLVIQDVSNLIPNGVMKVSTAVYDFEKEGGDVGLYTLPLNYTIPQGSILIYMITQQIEPVTFNNAYQLSIGLNTNDDIQTGVMITSFPDVYSNYDIVTTSDVTTMKLIIDNNPITGGVALFKFLYL